MQIAALVVLPLAIGMQLTDSLHRAFGLDQMLIMMVFGVALFYTGRLVEGYGRRGER